MAMLEELLPFAYLVLCLLEQGINPLGLWV